MKTNLIYFAFLLGLLLSTNKLFAQQWRVYLHVNEYYPIGNPEKGYYPILWYSGSDDRGLLFGGFGAGASWTKQLKEKLRLNVLFNGQRSRFYDVPVILLDDNGSTLGASIGINTHLSASVLALPTWNLGNTSIYAGGGLGVRGNFLSKTNYGKGTVFGEERKFNIKNTSIRPILPIAALELGWGADKKFSFFTRLETTIISASRLKAYKNEYAMTLISGIGYRL